MVLRARGVARVRHPVNALSIRNQQIGARRLHLTLSSTDEIGREVGAQVASIVAGAVDETRLAAPEERYAHQVHPGGLDDASVVADTALAVEHQHVEPRVVGTESGRPDDGSDLTVFEVDAEWR